MPVAKVGNSAPDFTLACVSGMDTECRPVRLSDYSGRWLAIVFYPRDFTLICPTELTAFSARSADFRERHCDLLGISADSIELHREWLTTPPDRGGLGQLQFPLAADPDGTAAWPLAFGSMRNNSRHAACSSSTLTASCNMQWCTA